MVVPVNEWFTYYKSEPVSTPTNTFRWILPSGIAPDKDPPVAQRIKKKRTLTLFPYIPNLTQNIQKQSKNKMKHLPINPYKR